MPGPFQVRDLTLLAINDVLRQIREELDAAMPAPAVMLYPEDRALPTGWAVADGTNDRPDFRAHGVSGYVYIVRLG